MYMLVFILAILSGFQLAASCWPPYLDFELGRNRTLLDEVIKQQDANPAMGWAHILGDPSPVTTWPPDPDGIVRIKYCFRNQRTKAELPWIKAGWELWLDRLGPAGIYHGHRFGTPVEYQFVQGIQEWCRERNGNWNALVPADTLEIYAEGSIDEAEAVIGYRPAR